MLFNDYFWQKNYNIYMKSKLSLFLLIAFLSISCKKEGNTKPIDSEVSEDREDIFTAAFDLIIQKDDNMHLYYTTDGTINFTEENSVWFPVKGSTEVQEVFFSLPVGVVPSLIRVDFGYGKNEAQSDVELKKFQMRFNDKVEEATGTDIFKYFTPFEPYTEIIPQSSTLRRKNKNQESGPILYPLEAQSEKINQVTGGLSPE